MNIKHILNAGLATAMLASSVSGMAADLRDPGHAKTPDKLKDAPVPLAGPEGTVTARTSTTSTAEDERDLGHAIVSDKLKDNVRRR